MKRSIAILFLTFFCMVAPQQSEAQFLKNLFKKEKPKKKHPVKKPAKPPVVEQPVKKKTKFIDYPPTVKKDRYRIDILLPLYLGELVKGEKVVAKDIPEKALPALNFYEGVKLAADTLKKLGYKLDVYVHDITDSSLSTDSLVKNNMLAESDLIIGALQSSQLNPLADFAKKSHINFISVLSPSDAGIRENPYFTILQPRLEKHCDRIRKAIFNKTRGKDALLLYRTNNPVDSAAYTYLSPGDDRFFDKLNINTLPEKTDLAKYFDSTRMNTLVLAIIDTRQAEDFLKKLYEWFPNYNFDVYGLPSWKFISSLKKPDAYPNVAVNFTSPFYFDGATGAGTTLTNSYKKEFGGKPADMVFRGYETLFWYAYLLNKYGTIFNLRQNDHGGAPFTRYELKPQWTKDTDLLYNENEHICLYRYQSGSYLVEQ